MLFSLLLFWVFLLSACSNTGPSPLSPDESLAAFSHADDVRVEVFAAEPYVRDPVDLVFDEEGRAYVAEMLDYPYDPPPGQLPRSRIRILEDRDGDGRVDHSVIFADKILQIKGLTVWNGGIIASAAPDLLFFKDTDGDQRADERRVLYTGFEVGQPQGRVSNLSHSVDNWIYVSNDGHPGLVRSTGQPMAKPVSVLGTDFRFRPDLDLFEAASGAARFGQTLDDWGNRFITRTGDHTLHVLLPRRYLERNPYLSTTEDIVRNISDHDRRAYAQTPPEKWRQLRTKIRQQRSNEMGLSRKQHVHGVFTGATGGTVYSGNRLPPAYQGNLFTGGVAGNLVHRDVLIPQGISFIASRPVKERQSEFLTSTDPWFRPVQFATGWDGNLYIVDFYRKLVEDPESIPEPIKQAMDFYSGTELGRIYRIVPARKSPYQPTKPSLGKANNQTLVEHLSHPNRWWRLTSQRLLVERQDALAIPLLRNVILKGTSAKGRLHALYTLEGLSALDAKTLSQTLKDPNPLVQTHAIGLSEKFSELLPRLLMMVKHKDPRVALQLAFSLGCFQEKEVRQALLVLALNHTLESGFRTAILSSKTGSSLKFLELLLERGNFPVEGYSEMENFVEELSSVVGARNQQGEIGHLLTLVFQSPYLTTELWQVAVLEGLARGLKLGHISGLNSKEAVSSLLRAMQSTSSRIQALVTRVSRHFRMPMLWDKARVTALDAGLSKPVRLQAISVLAAAPFQEVRPVLEHLLDSISDSNLSAAVLRTLGSFDDVEVSSLILSRWKYFSPADRKPALQAMLGHTSRVPRLLDALDQGQVEMAALGQEHRVLLAQHPDKTIRNRAVNLLRPEPPGHRDEIVNRYQAALDLAGDAVHGEEIFDRECSRCHQPQQGHPVGPDLRVGVQGHTQAQIIKAILHPSSEILGMFQNYIVTTSDGRTYGGVLAAEGPGSLTLRSGPGDEETILRARITEIRASQISLMPEGLEKSINYQEMADLIAYLQAEYLLEANGNN